MMKLYQIEGKKTSHVKTCILYNNDVRDKFLFKDMAQATFIGLSRERRFVFFLKEYQQLDMM